MLKTYDVHAHVVPTSLLDRLAKDGGRCGVSLVEDGGRTKIAVGQESSGAPRTDLVDLTARLDTMDRTGVDVQILSAWIALTAYTLPADQGAAWTRLFNESMAETVGGHPDRFLGLGTVPLQDGEAAAAELRYAVQQLGMVGAQIATTVAGMELDDPVLAPFWAAAEELRCIVVIHPDQVLPGREKPRYVLGNFVGNAAETTIAAAHLVYGGVLERHPDLRVVLVHGGGYAPYQAGRMDHGYQSEPRLTDKRLTRLPSDYLRLLYFDTVTHSPDVMRFLLDFAGPGHVVLGSDYPFEMGEADPVGAIQRLPGLAAADQEQIVSGNLARLVAEVRHGGSS